MGNSEHVAGYYLGNDIGLGMHLVRLALLGYQNYTHQINSIYLQWHILNFLFCIIEYGKKSKRQQYIPINELAEEYELMCLNKIFFSNTPSKPVRN